MQSKMCDENVLEQMISMQRQKLLDCARKIIPFITSEDLLQPQDFPELETDPELRFEEGVLIGLQSALAAIRATSPRIY